MQIKVTAGDGIAMYGPCTRLVLFRIVSPEEAEIVFDGPGDFAWSSAGKPQKNGQRVVSLAKLRGPCSRSRISSTGGAALLIDRDEKAQVAGMNLRAGRKGG